MKTLKSFGRIAAAIWYLTVIMLTLHLTIGD